MGEDKGQQDGQIKGSRIYNLVKGGIRFKINWSFKRMMIECYQYVNKIKITLIVGIIQVCKINFTQLL